MQRMGAPIHKLFDVITGTSTGAFTALLATRSTGSREYYSATEIVAIYLDTMPRFLKSAWGFGLFWPKYRSRPTERELEKCLGEARLSDSLTRVIVPVYVLRENLPRFMAFSSLAAQNDDGEDFLVRDVVRGAISGPGYLPAFDVQSINKEETHRSIDGGLYINNPAISAWMHAFQEFDRVQERGRPERYRFAKGVDCSDAVVVSLGTGQIGGPVPHLKAQYWGFLRWSFSIMQVVNEGQSDAVNDHLRRAAEAGIVRKFFRLQPDLPRDIKQDDTHAMKELKGIADDYVEAHAGDINAVCAEL